METKFGYVLSGLVVKVQIKSNVSWRFLIIKVYKKNLKNSGKWKVLKLTSFDIMYDNF